MRYDFFNMDKLNKVNYIIFLFVVSLCSIGFYHKNNELRLIDFAVFLTLMAAATAIAFIKSRRQTTFAFMISLAAAGSIYYTSFRIGVFPAQHELLAITFIMAGYYFDVKTVCIYSILQNMMLVAMLLLKPQNLLGVNGNHIYEKIGLFMVLNFVAAIIGFGVLWGKRVLKNASVSYLEMAALHGEIADRERELKNKSSQLTSKEEEIGSLYNQVAASEQELKWQYTTIEENEKKLRQNQEIFRAISETSNDGIWYLDLIKGEKNFSKNWCDILGFSPNELSNMDFFKQLIHPEDVDKLDKTYAEQRSGRMDRYKCQYRIRTKYDNYIWVDEVGKVLFNNDGVPVLVVGANTDITAAREQNDKIEFLAYHDVLTGLPNRILMYDRLAMSIHERHRKHEALGIILMDLDNFKMINDGFSHSFGDAVLKFVAKRLSSIVRESDTLARSGGDAFAIILNNIKDYNDVTKLSERIVKVLEEPIHIKGQDIEVRCSMGFAVYPEDGENGEELLKNADTALYKAKVNGKNGYQFYNKDMKSDILHKIDIEKRIREGIKNNEFILYFQPQIDIHNQQLRGFEALVRWVRGKEIIAPGRFIPIAEESGLIVELGQWILMEACRKNREWQLRYGVEIITSVNISVLQLNQRTFVQNVKNALDETGMKPECLELEITESMFIGSFDECVSKLNELKKLGVKIALDDFGTGYSSLNYLQYLPIDTLKIDKTFIDGITETDHSKDIVGPIINLIQSLGLCTVAEGVETRQQLDYLAQNGCEHIQGYIFSKPLPEQEAANMLAREYKVSL